MIIQHITICNNLVCHMSQIHMSITFYYIYVCIISKLTGTSRFTIILLCVHIKIHQYITTQEFEVWSLYHLYSLKTKSS